jgi:hypothetical protein
VKQKRRLTEMDSKNEKENAEDLKLMKDPLSWYRWPILPVKKIPDNGGSGGRPEFGFLLAIGKPIVYLKNMYDLQELGVTTVKEIIEKVAGKEYSSFERIIDDGWIVD